ncbi:MAG: vWA domain-containing protein [Thiolinea sp.]
MKKIMIQRLLTASVLSVLLNTTTLAETTTQSDNQQAATPQQSTMIVLDGSNSMWGQLQGINKIVTARESLKTLLENAHGSINFGLLTYGNKRKKSCNDFTLVSKPDDYDMVSLLKNIYRMNPKGRSPIADALKKAASILPAENAHILLVSDGEESCDGDPCAVAKELREANPSLQIDVIGFRAEKEAQLECIAENGNGAFVVADNTERLKTLLAGVQAKAQMIQNADSGSDETDDNSLPGSVEISIKPNGTQLPPRANYSIYTLDGNNVASFTSRTQVKEYLKPGQYRVKALWKGRSETNTVRIKSGQTSRLEFDAGIPAVLRISAIDADKLPVAVNYSVYMQNGDFISQHVLRSSVEAKIPAGAYRVKADYNGKVIEKNLRVVAGQNNDYTFEFED